MAAPEVGGQGGGITEDLRAFFKQRSNAQNLTDFAMGATLGERAALRSARARIRFMMSPTRGWSRVAVA